MWVECISSCAEINLVDAGVRGGVSEGTEGFGGRQQWLWGG